MAMDLTHDSQAAKAGDPLPAASETVPAAITLPDEKCLREAIGKVTEKGYAENPYEGGEVFLRLVGLVIEALGPQWGHLSTGILELKRQVAGLWIALEHEKQASLWDEVECPDVDEEDVPVRTQERSMQCSMKSEQTSHEAR